MNALPPNSSSTLSERDRFLSLLSEVFALLARQSALEREAWEQRMLGQKVPYSDPSALDQSPPEHFEAQHKMPEV